MANLADLAVVFSVGGKEELDKALEDVKAKTEATGKALENLGNRSVMEAAKASERLRMNQEKLHKEMAQVQEKARRAVTIEQYGQVLGRLKLVAEKMPQVLRGMNLALLAGGAAFTGLVVSGFRASAFGQVFGLQMERLARTIGGLFKPEMHWLLNAMDRLNRTLANLTPAQRETIANWVKFAVVLKTATFAVKAFWGSLGPLGWAILAISAGFAVFGEKGAQDLGVMKELGESLGGLFTELGKLFKELSPALEPVIWVITKMVQLLTEAVKAIKWIIQNTKESFTGEGLYSAAWEGVDKQAEEWDGKDRSALPVRLGAPEGVDQTWMRIAQASIKATAVGKSPEEEQVDWLKAIHEQIANMIGDALARGGNNPNVVRKGP